MEVQLFYLFHLEEHESTDAESCKLKKAEESGRVIVETKKEKHRCQEALEACMTRYILHICKVVCAEVRC